MARLEAIFALIAAGIGAIGAVIANPRVIGIAVAVALVVTTMRILDPARSKAKRGHHHDESQPTQREHEITVSR